MKSKGFRKYIAYFETNEKLDKIYQEKTNVIRIRSQCDW